jgi:hypothetical protein
MINQSKPKRDSRGRYTFSKEGLTPKPKPSLPIAPIAVKGSSAKNTGAIKVLPVAVPSPLLQYSKEEIANLIVLFNSKKSRKRFSVLTSDAEVSKSKQILNENSDWLSLNSHSVASALYRQNRWRVVGFKKAENEGYSYFANRMENGELIHYLGALTADEISELELNEEYDIGSENDLNSELKLKENKGNWTAVSTGKASHFLFPVLDNYAQGLSSDNPNSETIALEGVMGMVDLLTLNSKEKDTLVLSKYLEEASWYLTAGNCHSLATAIHARTGWEMLGLRRTNSAYDYISHVVVRSPDGFILDGDGVADEEEYFSTHALKEKFSWNRIEPLIEKINEESVADGAWLDLDAKRLTPYAKILLKLYNDRFAL